MYTAFDYQDECLEAVQKVYDSEGTKALIVMASSLGKTVTMALGVKTWRQQKNGRTLYLCNSNEILRQCQKTFQEVHGTGCTYGFFGGDEKDFRPVDFLFASFQTMEKYTDLFAPDTFDYIVVDESHHSQANTYRSTIEYFRPRFLLGATATPDRLDELDIREIFGPEVYSLPLEEAMARGLVTPVDYRLLTDEIQISKVLQTEKGKVSIGSLNRKIFIPRRDEEIVKIITRHASEFKEPRIIIFCASIEHCEHMAQIMPDSFAIHSLVPKQERAVKLEMFRQGIVNIVLTVDCFNEGIDVPEANVVVFLRVTSSKTIFLQQLGRGLRRSEGKNKVIVLDFVANCERIKMVHTLWRTIEENYRKNHDSKGSRMLIEHPMILNVNTVEFTETIVPLLKLMGRMNPLRISQVEHLHNEYSPKNLIPADQAIAGACKKYWWKCSRCNHEWEATGNARMSAQTGCPKCFGRAVTDSNNLLVMYPKIAAEYSSKNILPADRIRPKANKEVLWRCSSCNHEWQAKPLNRVIRGDGCPACSGRVPTQENNLASTHPHLANEYSSKNLLPPNQVIAGTNKKLWWKCSRCNHEWEATGSSRAKGVGCPACANRVVTPLNCIATHPILSREYSSRNKPASDQVIRGTSKKLWWKCEECSHEWEASGNSRLRGHGCPACSKRVKKPISE